MKNGSWTHRLPNMERDEERTSRTLGVPLKQVQNSTDRLIRELDRPLTRADFGYPKAMTDEQILGFVEAAVFDMQAGGRLRDFDRARLMVLFGY